MMIPSTAKRLAGAVLAAITLTMVASVAPATAADKTTSSADPITFQRSDSGWGGV
jgi:hypothetical protein